MFGQLLQLVYQLTFETGILRMLAREVTNMWLFCASCYSKDSPSSDA